MIFQIDESTPYPTFPDPRSGDEDGLFAVGGDLSIDRLLLAYCHGIFPWYSFRDQPDILWYCPMQRFVIFPEEIHVSHSMRTLINKDQYSYSINEAFDDVIAQCSKLRIEQDGAWLGDDMIKAYTELHRQGFASSVEVWDDATDQLVGLVPSASKLALIYLARFMQRKGMKLIDCQLETPHLRSMGGRFISYDDYLKIINDDES